MLNKRVKEGIKSLHTESPQIRFCLGTLALMFFCIVLLVIATFTQIRIDFGAQNSVSNYLRFEYIPQIPIVIFIAALLGETWGLVTILFYIILGLTPAFPFFGLGGGLTYIFQYNFGYIFAYIFAVLLSAKELKRGNGILNIVFAMLYAVISIHAIGIIYMFIVALIRHDSLQFMGNFIYYQSLSKILYDIVFGIIAILFAKLCKKFIWLITG
ncbi:biotin transporter BioY [bacterium]|nr:biotin transporter BioY [bacterium]